MYQNRAERLSQLNAWTLEGRLAINDGEDGGSGRFRWKEQADSTRMEFHGALGRGAWRLIADSGGAVLETADGSVHRAGELGELVRDQVGWQVPVNTLAWWTRGLAAPGEVDDRILDENGSLSRLVQGGWVIEFGRYRSFGGIDMPVKLTARKADWTVKLAVREWRLGAGAVTGE